MKLLEKIAIFFSVAFQPLFAPLMGIASVLYLNEVIHMETTSELRSKILLLTLILTVVLPVITLVFFYKMKWVSDFNLTVREERIIPTFIIILFFIALYTFVRNLSIPTVLYAVFFGSIVGTLIANIITFSWKISIHAMGVFSVIGMLTGVSLISESPLPSAFPFFVLIAFAVGISRLILKRHTTMQVIAGSILGFTSPFLAAIFNIYY